MNPTYNVGDRVMVTFAASFTKAKAFNELPLVQVLCVIKAVRPHSYGRRDYQVTPVQGKGEVWIRSERLEPYRKS